ncbi:taurine dioxygenase [Labrenzia sp. EL_142]|nr:taurine dioxygenase [Labrenzia sp. EL_142]
MTYETIEVRPVTPSLGAEVDGVDLTGTLAPLQIREIQHALLAHQVLFFRNQRLTFERHKEFGRLFGDLAVHPYAASQEGHPEVLPIYADANSKQIPGERWHSDVSCDPEPPMGSILHIHTLPPVGGDTLFSNMYAAYEALSDRMKTYLETLVAVHDGAPGYRMRAAKDGKQENREFPQAEHPVIRTHPQTGRKLIFVNPVFTTAILDLPAAEGDMVLRFLFDHCNQPQFHARFRWQENSVAFWDNRCVQHIAMWDYFPQTRAGNRVTIRGDKPY